MGLFKKFMKKKKTNNEDEEEIEVVKDQEAEIFPYVEVDGQLLVFSFVFSALHKLGIDLISPAKGVLHFNVIKNLERRNKKEILSKIKVVRDAFFKYRAQHNKHNSRIKIVCKYKPPRWLRGFAQSENIEIEIDPHIEDSKKASKIQDRLEEIREMFD